MLTQLTSINLRSTWLASGTGQMSQHCKHRGARATARSLTRKQRLQGAGLSRRTHTKTARRRCQRTHGRVHFARPSALLNGTTTSILRAGDTRRTQRPGVRSSRGPTVQCVTCNATVRRIWSHTSSGGGTERRYRAAIEMLGHGCRVTVLAHGQVVGWVPDGFQLSICHFEGRFTRWWTKLLLLHFWSAAELQISVISHVSNFNFTMVCLIVM